MLSAASSGVLLCLLPFANGQALGCLWGGDNRCGLCVADPSGRCRVPTPSDPHDCSHGPAQYLDEALLFYDLSSMSAMEFCGAYMEVAISQPGDVTPGQLSDIETGVPRLSYAISKVVYGLAGHEGVGADCVSDVLKQGITGQDLQTCMNEWIVTNGESALEQAACDYLSGGVLAPFCSSALFKAATGVVNSFVNKYIEQPIVQAMDDVEDSLVGIAKTCANWFSGLFSAGLPQLHVPNNATETLYLV